MDFIQRDRGHVRRGSDKTLGTRAEAFRRWCDRHTLRIGDLYSLTPEGIIVVLGQYLTDVAKGDNFHQRADLQDGTIHGYLQAAVRYLQVYCPDLAIPLYSAAGGSSKSDSLHPYLAAILSDRRTWRQPKEKKQPISSEMITAMEVMAAEYIQHGKYGNFGRYPVLWDLACLACYTGSRIGEYGVSRTQPGAAFPTIPHSSEIPEAWRGRPIAFIPEDFEFYDKHMAFVPWSVAHQYPSRITFLIVRFRFDKSPKNFEKRKFKRVPGNFCIIRASWSILDRYFSANNRLQDEPIGFFTAENGRRLNVSSSHVKKFLQEACIRAHPNAQHYLRRHIGQLVSHSFRVTAAVALSNAQVSIDDITYRLRWNSDAVQCYLRDSARAINKLSFKAMQGAYMPMHA